MRPLPKNPPRLARRFTLAGMAGLAFALAFGAGAETLEPPGGASAPPPAEAPAPARAAQPETPALTHAPPAAPAPTEAELTGQYLAANTSRYRSALTKARAWLDQLVVDPFDLRDHGIKGKKKLAEFLDTYRRLLAIAGPADRPALKERIRTLAAVTADPRFHDLPTLDETTFKEDATSYLRIAFILDQMALLPPLYREGIAKAHPRLNEHMRTRGVNQQMAFHLYYQYFGLAEPFPLATAFQGGVIAARRPASWFERRLPVYDLTHEIFVPYEFGEKPDADFFSAEDKAYLRPLLAEVSRFYIGLQDPDVVGELASCMSYLKLTDMREYREAIEYLLASQRTNGSWGEYDWLRARYGDYVDQGFYLHTTMVVLDALTTTFAPLAAAQPPQPDPKTANPDAAPAATHPAEPAAPAAGSADQPGKSRSSARRALERLFPG